MSLLYDNMLLISVFGCVLLFFGGFFIFECFDMHTVQLLIAQSRLERTSKWWGKIFDGGCISFIF